MRAGLWTGLPDLDKGEHHYQVVTCPEDVDTLIEALARPECNDGSLEHFDRQPDSEGEADHNLMLAVRGSWGYVNYVDNEFAGWTKGDPDSPFIDESFTDYPPGTGVPLDKFRELLVEFLDTGKRPTVVDWYSEDELFHTWRSQRLTMHED
jgi:hypothetical protein